MRLSAVDGNIWTLEALDPADGYAGAFVVGSREYDVNYYDFCEMRLAY